MTDTKPAQDLLSTISSAGAVAGATVAAPSQEPPAAAVRGTAGAVGTSVWVNNKTINALWSINENRNSWVGVAGVGWVKLSNASDSAIVALTIVAASARQTQGVVNYRQEADNMIHEIYAW